jgi:hypothetical protein
MISLSSTQLASSSTSSRKGSHLSKLASSREAFDYSKVVPFLEQSPLMNTNLPKK